MKPIPVCLLICACAIFTSAKAQKTTLSTAETNALIVVHENQKLSLFVYDSLYAIWGINPFGNIRSAESQHVSFLMMLQIIMPLNLKQTNQETVQQRLLLHRL